MHKGVKPFPPPGVAVHRDGERVPPPYADVHHALYTGWYAVAPPFCDDEHRGGAFISIPYVGFYSGQGLFFRPLLVFIEIGGTILFEALATIFLRSGAMIF